MKKVLILILALISPYSNSCSFDTGIDVDKKKLMSFRVAELKEGNFGVPIISLKNIYRASHDGEDSCSDTGAAIVELEWDERSAYKIQDLMFLFESEEKNEITNYLVGIPFVLTNVQDNKAKIVIPWIDDLPENQNPFDFTLKVQAINLNKEIGKSSELVVKNSKMANKLIKNDAANGALY